jgi:hypothetical protein
METDWPKVLEVFGSGIIGVFLVMVLLQLLTQLSTRVIDVIDNLSQADEVEAESKKPTVAVKE